jgi:hypothetical protein
MIQRLTLLALLAVTLGLVMSASANLPDGDRLLVWTAPALAPQEQFADQVGDLAYIESDNSLNTIAPILQQSTFVEPCTMRALSPDGRHFAIYQGTAGGVVASLYLMTDGASPVLVDDSFNLLACRGGNGTFTYSEDSSRLAYIDYERTNQVDFADGIFRLVDTTDLTEVYSQRQITAFTLDGDTIFYARFFTDTFNEADELAVVKYDLATGDEQEIATLFVEDDEICRFLGAKLAFHAGSPYLSLISRCDNQDVNVMSVYELKINGDDPTLLFTEETRVQFAPFSETNNLIFANDDSTLLYTLPDGVTNNTVGLYAYNLESGDKATIVPQNIIIPTFSGTGDEATWRISRDGKWLGVVLNAPNFDARTGLRVISLDDPFAPQAAFDNRSQEDLLPFFTFNGENDKVIFIAGGSDGDDNSIYTLPVTGGEEADRVVRGNFSRWAVSSPRLTSLAVMEYQIQEEAVRGPNWLNTVIVDLDSGAKSTVFVGGEVVDNEVQNIQFAQPILWMRE